MTLIQLDGYLMKSLSDHNDYMQKRQYIFNADEALAGVLCDDCGTEMHYVEPGVVLASNPPKKTVVCPKCKKQGYKVV